MSYTQFSCSDFPRVLFQVQVDRELKQKKKQLCEHTQLPGEQAAAKGKD